MKLFNLLMLLTIAQLSFAQIKLVKLDKKSIPASINYVGKIINAVRYTDDEGEHIIVTTETGETTTKGAEDGYRDMALYAYSYKIIEGQQTLSWLVHDFVKECPVDIKANYIPNTFAVTDLNKDGKAEVWLMYTTVCHGDVSPSNMKIIMSEGIKNMLLGEPAK